MSIADLSTFRRAGTRSSRRRGRLPCRPPARGNPIRETLFPRLIPAVVESLAGFLASADLRRPPVHLQGAAGQVANADRLLRRSGMMSHRR